MTRSRLLLAPLALATMLGACAGPSTAPTPPAAPQSRSATVAPSADETTPGFCRGGYTVASALTSCP